MRGRVVKALHTATGSLRFSFLGHEQCRRFKSVGEKPSDDPDCILIVWSERDAMAPTC